MCTGNFASTCVYQLLPCNAQGGQRKVYNLLTLESQVVGSHHVRAGNRTQVLRNNSQCSNLLSSPSDPNLANRDLARRLTVELQGLCRSGLRIAWPRRCQHRSEETALHSPVALLSVCLVPQTFRSLFILQALHQQKPRTYLHNYRIKVQNNVSKEFS